MEGVLHHWESLSITGDEGDVLGVEDALIAKGQELRRFNLLGKLLSRKPYNREAFKKTMAGLWRMDRGCVVRAMEKDVFLFSFDSEKERDRVLAMEPWHFENGLVVLKPLGAEDPIDWGDWRKANFWIQIRNVPPSGMIKEIGEVIGKGFGKCVEIDADSVGRCLGPYMRLRVEIDISKPLRRGARVRTGNSGEVIWVDARYERLPDFCFDCGRVGHTSRECLETSILVKGDSGPSQYGPWLRASFVRKGNVQISENRRVESEGRTETAMTAVAGESGAQNLENTVGTERPILLDLEKEKRNLVTREKLEISNSKLFSERPNFSGLDPPPRVEDGLNIGPPDKVSKMRLLEEHTKHGPETPYVASPAFTPPGSLAFTTGGNSDSGGKKIRTWKKQARGVSRGAQHKKAKEGIEEGCKRTGDLAGLTKD